MLRNHTGYVMSDGRGIIWKEDFVMHFMTVFRNLPETIPLLKLSVHQANVLTRLR